MILTAGKFVMDKSLQLMSFKSMIKNTICRIGIM